MKTSRKIQVKALNNVNIIIRNNKIVYKY